MISQLGRGGLIAAVIAGSSIFGNQAMAAEAIIKARERLTPIMQTKLSQLEKAAAKEGISFRVTETYRTQARQNEIRASGKNLTGVVVSKHTSGNAFDIAVNKGKGVTWDPKDYQRVGRLGKSVGLTWGGDWKRQDLVHFEIPTVKAAALSNVVKKHIPTPPMNHGVGIRAHDNKIKHNVKSQKVKLSVMQKVLKVAR